MDGFWANEEFRVYLETELGGKRKEMYCCVLWTSDPYVEAGYTTIETWKKRNEDKKETRRNGINL